MSTETFELTRQAPALEPPRAPESPPGSSSASARGTVDDAPAGPDRRTAEIAEAIVAVGAHDDDIRPEQCAAAARYAEQLRTAPEHVAARATVATHAAQCPDCSRALTTLRLALRRQVVQLGHTAAAPTAPAGPAPVEAPNPVPVRRRDADRHAPLFVLATARSHSTVVTTMIGRHHALYGFPELCLWTSDDVAQLLREPPGWKGLKAFERTAGLRRAIAQLHEGEQTEAGVARAMQWLRARPEWTTAEVMDHLNDRVAPRVPVENSPETGSRPRFLARAVEAYPRARFLHLTRHPVPTVRSMVKAWQHKGFWRITLEMFPQFCLGLWYFQNRRMLELVESLPAHRARRTRSEDILNVPERELPALCRWLEIDDAPEAVAPMRRPGDSPFAQLGPGDAITGGDPGFMQSPEVRRAKLPATLELPAEWIVDPWLRMCVSLLADRLGYGPTAEAP